LAKKATGKKKMAEKRAAAKKTAAKRDPEPAELPPFIFSADLHLQPYAWASHPSLRGDSYFGLNQILQTAKRYGCKLILLGGDIFETRRPTPADVVNFKRFTDDCAENGIRVAAVFGNHDRFVTQDETWLELTPQVIHLHKKTIEHGDMVIYGLDYVSMSELEEELANVPPEANTILTHNRLFAYGNADEGRFSPTWIPEHVTRILTGDYHEYREMLVGSRSVQVVYPGPTYMWRADEPVDKFVTLFSDSGGGYECTFVPLKTRRVEKHDVFTPEDLIMVTGMISNVLPDEELPESMREPLFIVRYDPEIEDAKVKLMMCASDRCHLFLNPVIREYVMLPSAGTETEDGVVPKLSDLLSQVVDPREEPKLHSFILSLLQRDTKTVLAEERMARGIEVG